jgi:hypothetical protein
LSSRELVDDQHLSVLHDVIHVLFVQRVCPQELMNDVESLALRRVIDIDRLPRRKLFFGVRSGS